MNISLSGKIFFSYFQPGILKCGKYLYIYRLIRLISAEATSDLNPHFLPNY